MQAMKKHHTLLFAAYNRNVLDVYNINEKYIKFAAHLIKNPAYLQHFKELEQQSLNIRENVLRISLDQKVNVDPGQEIVKLYQLNSDTEKAFEKFFSEQLNELMLKEQE